MSFEMSSSVFFVLFCVPNAFVRERERERDRYTHLPAEEEGNFCFKQFFFNKCNKYLAAQCCEFKQQAVNSYKYIFKFFTCMSMS